MTMTPENGRSQAMDIRRTRRTARDRQPTRKYGFACANCRRRKARCVGNLPSCDRCLANNETCYVDKAPSVSYALTLQNRLKTCETILGSLKKASKEERMRLLDEYFDKEATIPNKPPPRSSTPNTYEHDTLNTEISTEEEVTELLNETSVDEEGRICFYGKTSLYHFQPEEASFTFRPDGPEVLIGSVSHECGIPKDNAYTSTVSSDLNHQSKLESIINSDVTQGLVNELLDTYWCFPHHLHLVLCRKIFMRDLANSGPYVSVFLLNSVLAQAARFSDRTDAPKLSQYFAKKALDSLGNEIDKGSSIPTLQGLLILSARECASGRVSQGWLYSGMAFRMMRDLGIHIYPKSLSHLLGQFSPEDLAVRQQVFWSCYTWDKTMSLCLGRAPTIHDPPSVPAPETWADGEDAENEMWKPTFSNTSSSDVNVFQKSRTNSRFSAYCKLCIIIDDVLDTLYSRPHIAGDYLSGYLSRTLEKLESWANELPSPLYIRAEKRTASCPPLHTLLLNLLYHAAVILLCRPYRTKTEHACSLATRAAEMIDGLLTLHVKRFGFRVLTYLEMYTVFVGATINILDFKEREGPEAESAGARLEFNLEVLRNARSTPSTLRCVEIIQKLLKQKQSSGETPWRHEMGLHDQVSYNSTSPNLKAKCSANLSPYSTSRDSVLHSHPAVSTIATGSDASCDKPPFLGHTNNCNGGNFTRAPNRLAPGVPPPSNLQPCDLPIGMPADNTVETPLRWLLDNVHDDCGWMMMGMDFASGLDASAELDMNP